LPSVQYALKDGSRRFEDKPNPTVEMKSQNAAIQHPCTRQKPIICR